MADRYANMQEDGDAEAVEGVCGCEGCMCMRRRVACYCVSGVSYELAIAAFQNVSVTDTCVCAHV